LENSQSFSLNGGKGRGRKDTADVSSGGLDALTTLFVGTLLVALLNCGLFVVH
jgi:hypothetical protein